jgi:hypothetical protein
MALHAEMACREFVELVTPYLERRLDTATADSCEEHTLVCPGCDAYLEQIRETARRLRGGGGAQAETDAVPPPGSGSVRAYKFLRTGAFAPFARTPAGEPFRWPAATWVSGNGARACASGIHGCAVDQLPFWLNDELWLVELAGEVRREERKLVAGHGRLVERVGAWTPDAASRFGAACGGRVRAHAVAALRGAGFEREAEEVAAASWHGLRAVAERVDRRRAADAYASATYAADAGEFVERPVSAAYIAAAAAAHAADVAGTSAREAAAAERAWQADWLRRELALTD